MIEVDRDNADLNGGTSLDLALENLGNLYEAQGRFGDAEPLYERALGIDEKKVGTEHPDIAIQLGDLARVNLAQRRFADAESVYASPEHPGEDPQS
jgi:tetratricopeptide (TPR) repeat protein